MEGKNILYICDYGAGYTGSFIASLSPLSKKAGEKHQVYFLFPEAARGKSWLSQLPVKEGHLFFSDFSVKSLFKICRKLSGLLHSSETIVHTHFVGDFRLLAVRSAFRNVICHYHMMVPMGTTIGKKVKQMVRRVIYWKLIVVGVSEAVTKDAETYFYKTNCECIPNAVDFKMMDHCSAPPYEMADWAGQFHVLMHGSDFICKGVDLALRAVEELNDQYHDAFHLYMTSNHVEETWNQIRSVIGKPRNITVVPSLENIKSLYDSMDLYISPSREEAFSYAVVEAAYSGCQVAASDIPGQNTMKSVPGIFWFEKDDIQGLKNAILMAMEVCRSGEAVRIKEKQRDYVTREFRVETWVDRNIALYDRFFGTK